MAFQQPEVGKHIRCTTDWTDIHCSSQVWQPTHTTDEGRVVPNEPWDGSNPNGKNERTFRIETGNPKHPVAVIPLKRVTALEYVDGTKPVAKVEVEEDSDTWQVDGSKDNVYTVSRLGTQWSCTCPGYMYHNGKCKHVTAKKKEVLIARLVAAKPS